MNSIIVYGSNYGTTKQYANELSRRTNMKVISFKKVNFIDFSSLDEIINEAQK